MINFDDVVKEEAKEHDPNWPQIPSHPYRTLIFGDSDLEKQTIQFNLVHFWKNLLERIQKLIITIDDKIRDEKSKYDINREAEKISALSSEKLINMNILKVKKCCLLIKDK